MAPPRDGPRSSGDDVIGTSGQTATRHQRTLRFEASVPA